MRFEIQPWRAELFGSPLGEIFMSLPGFTAEASLRGKTEFYLLKNSGAQEIASAARDITPQLSLPIYGNYCGPGHGDPTGATPPIDAVDAACRAHDRCYASRGYFDCQCDRNLIASMRGAIASTSTTAGKLAGTAVMTYFANTFCLCRNRVCVTLPFIGRRCTTVTLPGGGGNC